MANNPNTQWPIDPLLTGVAVAAGRGPKLVGRQAMPRVKVESPDFEGQIVVANARDLRAANMGNIEAPPGGKFKQVEVGDHTLVPYAIKRYGLRSSPVPFEHDLRDQLKKVRPALGKRRRAFMKAFRTVQNLDERRIANVYGTAGNWTYNTTCVGIANGGGKQWSDPTSTPLQDMKALRTTFYNRNGVFPDSVRTSWQVVNVLSTHPDFLTSTITSGGSIVARPFVQDADVVALIAQVYSIPVENVIVGPGLADIANPGASESLGYLWGDFFWIGCLLGGQPEAVGDEVETDAIACIGLDEIAIPEAVVPGFAMLSQDMILGGEWMDPEGNWCGRAFHYSTEVVTATTLGQLATDCVA